MTAKARKPRKPRAKALQAAPDPVRRDPKTVEWAMDDIEDDARRLRALFGGDRARRQRSRNERVSLRVLCTPMASSA